MPAADSAQPEPAEAASAAILQLFPHRAPERLSKRDRKAPVPDTPEPSPHERLAESVETLFLKHDRTLSEPETAEAYLITLHLVATLFEGAHVNGLVDDQQHTELAAMIEGMRAVPGLL